MSNTDNIARYSFLPWIRQGLATHISDVSELRASVPVAVTLSSDKVASEVLPDMKVMLIGPGDITAISSDQIIRTEPKDWSSDFEPNYFPFIEFYDEDFPWRYSPAVASGKKLSPWLALVVLKADEFTDSFSSSAPLASIEVANADSLFPPSAQLWAWAHVHVNSDITADSLDNAVKELQTLLETDSSIAYSRILCPRKLEEKTSYHAFLIPAFETGRLAGLGLDVTADTATTPAWGNGQTSFPIYSRWYFSTTTEGDFESLVRLLKPTEADSQIGVREMDMTHPGANLTGLTDPTTLGLEGAVKAPTMVSTQWPNPYPDALQESLRELVNEGAQNLVNGNGDPEITPPLYGQWHALTDSLEEKTAAADLHWLDVTNLDPRNRTAAGFGTEVIRKNQETYMREAWEQVGRIIEANRKIKFGQFAKEASGNLFLKTFSELDSGRIIQLGFPVTKLVKGSPKTLFAYINQSSLSPTILSGPFRKNLRLHGPLMKRVDLLHTAKPQFLVPNVNDGKITATPPKTTPQGLTTLNESMAFIKPSPTPPLVVIPPKKNKLKWIPLLLILLVIVLTLIIRPRLFFTPHPILHGLFIAFTLLMIFIYRMFAQLENNSTGGGTDTGSGDESTDKAITENELTVAAIKSIPARPDFKIVSPGEIFKPTSGGIDNEIAKDFRNALTGLHSVFDFSATIKPIAKSKLDLDNIAGKLIVAMKPTDSIPKRVLSGIKLGTLQQLQLAESFKPVMAYPIFDDAMYEKLKELSPDYLVPNLDLISNNSITLLETNSKFMEAFLLGLNHEMSRELLWREFPTDQRGSYFRQFWDVSEVNLSGEMTDAEKEEYLRDISEIHTWGKNTELGEHPPKTRDANWKGNLVLVIRGQLLKRYPNTVIYAVPATWGTNEDGSINKDLTRIPQEGAEEKYPIFKATIDPDITLVGFNLTEDEAKGSSRDGDGTDAGWFFVLKERPGEPRFGFDEGDGIISDSFADWNDLSWDEINLAGEFANADLKAGKPVPTSNPDNILWGSSSAETAWITFQEPVMVSIHASEMLV
jgi:hypothetical protein